MVATSAGGAGAVDRRSAEHEIGERRFAGGGIDGVQRDGAENVDGIGRRQRQRLEPWRAISHIAAQQPIEQRLVHRQPARQDVARRRVNQHGAVAEIDPADREREIAGAVTHGVVELELVQRHQRDGAFGIDFGLTACKCRLSQDADAHAAGQ